QWLTCGDALSTPEERDGASAARVAQELKAADATDREDLVFREKGKRTGDRVVPIGEHTARPIEERQDRPAARTCDRLGVMVPIVHVVVLTRAIGAHDERTHGCVATIERKTGRDGVAGTTSRAAGEGVQVPTALRRS